MKEKWKIRVHEMKDLKTLNEQIVNMGKIKMELSKKMEESKNLLGRWLLFLLSVSPRKKCYFLFVKISITFVRQRIYKIWDDSAEYGQRL